MVVMASLAPEVLVLDRRLRHDLGQVGCSVFPLCPSTLFGLVTFDRIPMQCKVLVEA